MACFITFVSTIIILASYLAYWQQYDSNYQALALLMTTWFLVIWYGFKRFGDNPPYWPLLPFIGYYLPIYRSAIIIAANIDKTGTPTAFSDDLFYVTYADFIANCLAYGDIGLILEDTRSNQPGYVWLLGLIYHGLDVHDPFTQVLVAIPINTLALSLTALMIFRYASNFLQARSNLIFLIILAFVINEGIIGVVSVVRKDILIVFCITGLYISIRDYGRRRMRSATFLRIVFLLLALGLLRLQVGMVAAGLIAIHWVSVRKKLQKKSSLSSLVSLLIFGSVLVVMYVSNSSMVNREDSMFSVAPSLYAFHEDIGRTRFIFDLPLIGPALWYFFGPLLSVLIFAPGTIRTSLEIYPLGIGLISLVASKLFFILSYVAIFRSPLHIKWGEQRTTLSMLMILVAILLQIAGQAAESRHFFMAYPFMVLLCIDCYATLKVRLENPLHEQNGLVVQGR